MAANQSTRRRSIGRFRATGRHRNIAPPAPKPPGFARQRVIWGDRAAVR